MPQPRIHASHAARQAAYRARQRERQAAAVQEPVAGDASPATAETTHQAGDQVPVSPAERLRRRVLAEAERRGWPLVRFGYGRALPPVPEVWAAVTEQADLPTLRRLREAMQI
jgi:hypothetical protein